MRPFRSSLGVSVLSIAAIAAGYFGGRPLLERVEFARAESEVQSNRQQLSTVEDLSSVFRHVDKVVEPSVVKIVVHKTIHEQNSIPEDQIRRFFHEHGQELPPGDLNNGDEQEQGTGSGVIMETSGGMGYIVTNNHVASDATEMEVTLSDGRTVKGKVLGTDPKSDLAIVQIKADRLIPAQWGNSDELEKGDWVLAFGSPLNYIGSMTHGIVSALHRDDVGILKDGGYENFIQVDAPINPGNSGGPLVNIRGEVVGINTAIATLSGGFQGIGFAIPSNQARAVFNDLKDHGKVVRGWLGVRLQDMSTSPGLSKSFNYTGDSSVLVERTFPNTPAYGKLKSGDIVIALNGTPIHDTQQLRSLVANIPPEAKATVRVFRDGKEMDVDLVVGTQPDDLAAVLDHPGAPDQQNPDQAPEVTKAQGMEFQTLDKDTAAKLALQDITSGAVISNIDQSSLAYQAGLREGDVITKVGDTNVRTAHEAASALQKADMKQGIRLYVVSPQGSGFIFIQQPDAGN